MGFFGGVNRGLNEARDYTQKSRAATLDALVKRAQLAESGYDITQTGGGLFGPQFGLTKLAEPKLPPGYVKIGEKVEPDRSYLNPLEQSRMELNKAQAGGGMFGQTTIDVNGDATPPAQSPKDIFEKLDPQNKALVQGVLDYNIDPTKTSSMRQGQREKLVKFAASLDPTYDQTQFPTRSAYRKDFSSGKMGGNVRSFNTAIQHLGELNQAAGEVPSNPVMPIEAMQRFGAQQFAGNSPTAVSMSKENTALAAVSGELANIFKNSGGTDQEIDKWFKSYNPNSTKEAKQQFIKTGIDLMKGRMGSIDSDYERVMGKKNTNPLISKQSQSVMDQIYGKGQKVGGVLHVDANGNKAIVYPDGSYEEQPK